MSGMGTRKWQMGYGLRRDFDRLSNPDTEIRVLSNSQMSLKEAGQRKSE